MNKIKLTAAAIGAAMITGTAVLYRRADATTTATYKTAPVTRASLKATVSATGALSAVRTVQVGTQVSGQVSKLYVDFNDRVKKGQLLATIDPTLQRQAVDDAQAQVERAQATLSLAQSEYDRNKQLFDAKVLSASEFATTQSNFSVQQSNVKSAKIALDRARQNLSYTSIYAPIDGVIVERNVDVGQTVAASLSAPQIFLIANDLSEMQILASVDEGDIGSIKDGLPVQFTVQAYPNQIFTGSVRQVRLQSTTQDNVVSYTTVVTVKNDGRLRPGMTATVKFLTASADNVLTVPNAALHIAATPEMKQEAGIVAPTQTKTGTSAPRDSTRRFAGAGNGTGGGGAMLWAVDSAGKLSAIRVHTGLTDGQKTAVEGAKLSEGLQIVTSLAGGGSTTAKPATAPSTNPLQPQRPQGGGRGGL